MKAILKRLRRLETVAAPDEKERAAVEAILEARRQRLGANYEPFYYPPNRFEGCRTIADHILRARKLRMDAECTETAEEKVEASRTDIAITLQSVGGPLFTSTPAWQVALECAFSHEPHLPTGLYTR